jgi:hypothetical protein
VPQERLGAKVTFFLAVGLAFWSCAGKGPVKPPDGGREAPKTAGGRTERLESYTIKGMAFTYYRIPAGLGREDLLAAAQALHSAEPKAQLILVDDTSHLQEYINFARELSRGNTEAYFPTDWAKDHVVANVQKFMSGKYKLCQGDRRRRDRGVEIKASEGPVPWTDETQE